MLLATLRRARHFRSAAAWRHPATRLASTSTSATRVFQGPTTGGAHGEEDDDATASTRASPGLVWEADGADGTFRDPRPSRGTLAAFTEAPVESSTAAVRAGIATLMPKDYPSSVGDGYTKYVQGQIIGSVASSAGMVLSMQVRTLETGRTLVGVREYREYREARLMGEHTGYCWTCRHTTSCPQLRAGIHSPSIFPTYKTITHNPLPFSQALLHAVGLGQGALPMAAALNWVIKDGLGQLGGIIFASTINTKFDSDPKRWRLVSSIALDGACLLELLAPLVPALFIPIASVANVGKNISWLGKELDEENRHYSEAVTVHYALCTMHCALCTVCLVPCVCCTM